jgi:hypothetical protein
MAKQESTITVIARVKTKNLSINEDPEAGSGNDESGFYMWSMCHSFTVQLYKLQIRSSTGFVAFSIGTFCLWVLLEKNLSDDIVIVILYHHGSKELIF